MAKVSDETLQQEVRDSLNRQMYALAGEMEQAGMQVAAVWSSPVKGRNELAVRGTTDKVLPGVYCLLGTVLNDYLNQLSSDLDRSVAEAAMSLVASQQLPGVQWDVLVEYYGKLDPQISNYTPEASNG